MTVRLVAREVSSAGEGGAQAGKFHLAADSYNEFLELLSTRIGGEEVGRISPKRLYALVEILALIVSQKDIDDKVDDDVFDENWEHFLGILESNALVVSTAQQFPRNAEGKARSKGT